MRIANTFKMGEPSLKELTKLKRTLKREALKLALRVEKVLTFPVIFVRGRRLPGGFTELKALHESGGLDARLAAPRALFEDPPTELHAALERYLRRGNSAPLKREATVAPVAHVEETSWPPMLPLEAANPNEVDSKGKLSKLFAKAASVHVCVPEYGLHGPTGFCVLGFACPGDETGQDTRFLECVALRDEMRAQYSQRERGAPHDVSG